jgi:hypothetical protein
MSDLFMIIELASGIFLRIFIRIATLVIITQLGTFLQGDGGASEELGS